MLCRSHTLNLDYLQYRGRLKSASQGRRDRDPGQLVSKYAHKCLVSWEALTTIGTPGRKGLHENENFTEKTEQTINSFEPPDATLPEVLFF